MRADLLVRLIDEDGLRAIEHRPRDRAARPSEFEPDVQDRKGVSAIDEAGWRAVQSVSAGVADDAEVSRVEDAASDCRLNKFAGLDFSQHREVGRHFAPGGATCGGAVERRPAGMGWATLPPIGLSHARFQEDLVDQLADGLAKIIHVDPPYGLPEDRSLCFDQAASQPCVCDGQMSRAAIGLVIDLLRDWRLKLAPGGVLLLWQPSGPLLDPDPRKRHPERFAWELGGPMIWDKGRPQPGDLESPYSCQTEMFWVLSRRGDALLNHNGSSRSDILRFAPVSFPGMADNQLHCFEKPLALCEFLIQKRFTRWRTGSGFMRPVTASICLPPPSRPGDAGCMSNRTGRITRWEGRELPNIWQSG